MSLFTYFLVALAAVAGLLLLLEIKTSRPDGDLLPVHPYRRLMPYIMPGRNESVVYFDSYADVTELLKYLDQANEEFGGHLTHACVYAGFQGLTENPEMNRFCVGRRLYQRKGRFITFSMKRKKLNKKAKLSAVKMEYTGQTFKEFAEQVNAKINVERSGKKTYADKEFDLFNLLPRVFLRPAAYFLRWLDYYNLLPGSFIEGDGMYTSIFVANLGSVGMDPGYHHLYEWGSCPLFMMVGRVHDRPVVVDGKVEVRKTMHIRWSFDERISDGLTARHGIDSTVAVLEDPWQRLGGLEKPSAV